MISELKPAKALSDLKALMKEVESVESNLFNKNTASRLASWSHTWLKSHGNDVIAALDRAPMELTDSEWRELYMHITMDKKHNTIAAAGRQWLAERSGG